jgi:putative hydroxymethylpyrimidine transport system substrate-binding protein
MRRARRVVPAVLVLAALVVTAVGCGEKSEPTNQTPAKRSLDLVLDWFPNPDHVALYEATAKGYFSQVGLAVKPHVPSDPASPIKQVAAGRAQVAISYEPEVLLARQQGLPVVAIGALVQRPLTSLIATRKSRVRSVRDLRGKRVGTAGIPYQSAYLKTILRRAQVPESSVKETNVGSSLLPAMLSGKVDATLGGFWNVEGVELKDRGAKPWIAPVDRLGVPAYNELVLVANSDKLGDQRDDLRLFVSALARGAKAARQDPRGATKALRDANRDLKAKETEASVRLTIPTLFPKSGRPWGYQDPVAWRNYGGWMVSNGVLKTLPNIQGALTNDLLPGQGLK